MPKIEEVSARKSVSIRFPNDTPKEVYQYLDSLREKYKVYTKKGETFNSECSSLMIEAIMTRINQNVLRVVLPDTLTPEEKEWFHDPRMQEYLGKLLYALATSPEKLAFALGDNKQPVSYSSVTQMSATEENQATSQEEGFIPDDYTSSLLEDDY